MNNKPEIDESDIFTIYYDECDKDMLFKPSNKNIAYSNKTLGFQSFSKLGPLRRSSVLGAQILRGFSLREVQQKHFIAQGNSDKGSELGNFWGLFGFRGTTDAKGADERV